MPVNFISRTEILGPHLFVRLPLFEQYFVVYFMGSKPRLVVGGNQDLQPAVLDASWPVVGIRRP